MLGNSLKALCGSSVIFAAMVQPAMAYIGPGAGLSAIGTFLALIFAVLVAIVGFFWYPIKRLIKGRKADAEDEEEQAGEKPDND